MLTEKFFQAIEVVSYIAINAGSNPVSSKNICDYKCVKQRHLEPLLQQLVRSGIIKGAKGPKGGYSLAREQRKISVYDILECSMALKKFEICDDTPISTFIVSPLRVSLNLHIKSVSEKIFLSDITKNYTQKDPQKESSESFEI